MQNGRLCLWPLVLNFDPHPCTFSPQETGKGKDADGNKVKASDEEAGFVGSPQISATAGPVQLGVFFLFLSPCLVGFKGTPQGKPGISVVGTLKVKPFGQFGFRFQFGWSFIFRSMWQGCLGCRDPLNQVGLLF